MPERNMRLAIIAGLFFLSGFSALIYQIAWQRLLGLFGGADTIASTLVVSAFLAGLGLGSLIGGLYADRLTRRRAMVLFGLCELLIATYGALSVPLFYDVLFLGLVELSRSRLLVLIIAFFSLIVPTALMGMSLPFLSRAMIDDIDSAPERIGVLYGINTLGAGVGALVAGFWLIGSFGYWSTILLGAAFNAIVGVGALLVNHRARLATSADPLSPVAATAEPAQPGDDGVFGRWCAYVFASGFLAVVVQIVWYRIHGTLMQGNAYGFALVLGVFLVGDAIGLLIGARMAHRVADPKRLLFLLQGATALIAAGAIYGLYLADGVTILAQYLVNADRVAVPGTHALAVVAVVTVSVLSASVVMGHSLCPNARFKRILLASADGSA
jgi:MFS family permease